jgi:hypothetical protein
MVATRPCRGLQSIVRTNLRNAAILAAFSGAGKMPALRNLSLHSVILNKTFVLIRVNPCQCVAI